MMMKTIFRIAVGGALAVAGIAALAHNVIKRDPPLIHR